MMLLIFAGVGGLFFITILIFIVRKCRKSDKPTRFDNRAPAPFMTPSPISGPTLVSSSTGIQMSNMPSQTQYHARPVPPPSFPGSLPLGWVQAKTPEGATYYYNQNTGASQWDPPRI